MERHSDFDLKIVASPDDPPGTYAVRVLDSPAGTASGTFVLPFSATELATFMNAVGPPRVSSRRLVPLTGRVDGVRGWGGRLGDALFAGDVGTAFRASLAEARATGSSLRIRLRLEDAPDLEPVPWEYVYDGRLERFLTLSTRTPLVRVLDSADTPPPLQVTPPLRVLVMISSPTDMPELAVEREKQLLLATTADMVATNQLHVTVLDTATLTALQHALLEDYHVFHFIGHGGFDDTAQEGVLVLENADGTSHRVSGARLGTLLHDARTLQLAVLNACEGARTSGRDAFSGVGQALVRQGLPAVVAMQTEISDRAALVFSHEFYSFLTRGLGIDAAMCEVRKAMAVSDEASEWGTAVLLCSEQGQPFVISSRPGVHIAAVTSTSDDARWESIYVVAVAALADAKVDVGRPLLQHIAAERPGFRDVEARLAALDAVPAPDVLPAPAKVPTSRPPRSTPPSRPPRAPAGRPTTPPSNRRPWRWLGTALLALVVGGSWWWWSTRATPLLDACGNSLTSSGDVTPQLVLPCAVEVPQIDGDLGEWASGAAHAFGPLPLRASTTNPTARAGAASSWKARWDASGLYLLADVRDATRTSLDLPSPTAYASVDGVTLLWGADSRRLQRADPVRSGDAAVTLAVGATGRQAVVATDRLLTRFAPATDVLWEVVRDRAGYRLEARIPWSTLGTDPPKANSVVALTVLMTDGTGRGRPRILASRPDWTAGNRTHPATWQTTILSFNE